MGVVTAEDTTVSELETVVEFKKGIITLSMPEDVIYVTTPRTFGNIRTLWNVSYFFSYRPEFDAYVRRFRRSLLQVVGNETACLVDMNGSSLEGEYDARLQGAPTKLILTLPFVHGKDMRRAIIDVPLRSRFLHSSLKAVPFQRQYGFCSVNGNPDYVAVASHGALLHHQETALQRNVH